MTYPYSDEYMIFKEETGRYVLTSKFIFDKYGIDLASQLNTRDAQNPQILADVFLEEVSDDIYNLIHEYGKNNDRQDFLIAKVPSLRTIIQKAMGQQFLYSRFNGLLAYDSNKDVSAVAVCNKAVKTLMQTVPELGFCILYTGDM